MKKTHKHAIQYKRINDNKHILQFWSGGADSTYLLLQNILTQRHITATYVNITNNKTKVERERNARELLKQDIATFCDYFHCPKPIYMADHSISVTGESFGRCPAPQQIIFAMFAMLIGKGYDEIQMGVVLGDSMCGCSLNSDFVEVFRRDLTPFFPDITYPIESVSKEAIYLTLKGYDDLIGTHFIEHLTCCESVGDPCGDVRACKPCQTQQEVFERLKWAPTNHS